MNNEETIIRETKDWIERFILGLNICPFASTSYQEDKIRYMVLDQEDPIPIIQEFLKFLVSFLQDRQISNAFLILPRIEAFELYLDLLETLTELLEESGAADSVQLASFHPNYQYADTKLNELGNYRNRSPFPMIHFLRVGEVAAAIESHPDTLSVSEININKLEALGADGMNKHMGYEFVKK